MQQECTIWYAPAINQKRLTAVTQKCVTAKIDNNLPPFGVTCPEKHYLLLVTQKCETNIHTAIKFESIVNQFSMLTPHRQSAPTPHGKPRRLYEATKSDAPDYKPSNLPIEVEAKFDILFDHRWFLFCKMMDRKFIDMRPHLVAFNTGYHGPVVYRGKFDNMLCIPVSSPYYQGLPQEMKDTFTHNLVMFYEIVYGTLHRMETNACGWNKLNNDEINN